MEDDLWRESFECQCVAAIHAFGERYPSTEVSVLACDCHPWDGMVSLCILTVAEVAADPLLDEPSEMASWAHFHFPDGKSDWSVNELCDEMKRSYESSQEKAVDADRFLSMCASVLLSSKVTAAIEKIQTSPAFRFSVPHPDDDREFIND